MAKWDYRSAGFGSLAIADRDSKTSARCAMRQEDEGSLYHQKFEDCIRHEDIGPTQSFPFYLMLYFSL